MMQNETPSQTTLKLIFYIFNIAGGDTWKSKKQTILVQATTEFEMIALTTTSEEASWL